MSSLVMDGVVVVGLIGIQCLVEDVVVADVTLTVKLLLHTARQSIAAAALPIEIIEHR